MYHIILQNPDNNNDEDNGADDDDEVERLRERCKRLNEGDGGRKGERTAQH